MTATLFIYTGFGKSDYMPFGTRFTDTAAPTDTAYRHRFAGKEDQAFAGLPYIDFGARLYDPATARWSTSDPMAEKYTSISPFLFCAGNPVNIIDKQGDSLTIIDLNLIYAIYNGMEKGSKIELSIDNGKVIPSDAMKSFSDWFIRDLYEISTSDKMIYLDLGSEHQYIDTEGTVKSAIFEKAPYDDNDKDIPGLFMPEGYTYLGKHIQGNLGVTLTPDKGSSKRSLDNNIHIIINSKGNINHRTVGIAHEFGHAILFLRGEPYQHGNSSADNYIYRKSTLMSRRLGYDN